MLAGPPSTLYCTSYCCRFAIFLRKRRLIDLIDWCLTSSEQFFSYIQDDRKRRKEYTIACHGKITICHVTFDINSVGEIFTSSLKARYSNEQRGVHTGISTVDFVTS